MDIGGDVHRTRHQHPTPEQKVRDGTHSETTQTLLAARQCLVAESDDGDTKRLLADTVVTALRRSDLPGGALSSWGATRLPENVTGMSAGALAGGFFGSSPRRMLGPVEYLVVWHLQRTQRTSLGADAFRRHLALLVDLLNHSS